MDMERVTRGFGALEAFLARRRAGKAIELIPSEARSGRILDIGCGNYPYFLSRTAFAERYGLEKNLTRDLVPADEGGDIQLVGYDIEQDEPLPFDDCYFDIVTMLAVIEHIDSNRLETLLCDVLRVLRPEGRFIFTTPTPLAKPVLDVLLALRLVSAVEINEHKEYYSQKKLRRILDSTGYVDTRIGYFEGFMNTHGVAVKPIGVSVFIGHRERSRKRVARS